MMSEGVVLVVTAIWQRHVTCATLEVKMFCWEWMRRAACS